MSAPDHEPEPEPEPEPEAEPEPSLEERLEAYSADVLTTDRPDGASEEEDQEDSQHSCADDQIAVWDGNLKKHNITHDMFSDTWNDDPATDLRLKKLMAEEILRKQEYAEELEKTKAEVEKLKGALDKSQETIEALRWRMHEKGWLKAGRGPSHEYYNVWGSDTEDEYGLTNE